MACWNSNLSTFPEGPSKPWLRQEAGGGGSCFQCCQGPAYQPPAQPVRMQKVPATVLSALGKQGSGMEPFGRWGTAEKFPCSRDSTGHSVGRLSCGWHSYGCHFAFFFLGTATTHHTSTPSLAAIPQPPHFYSIPCEVSILSLISSVKKKHGIKACLPVTHSTTLPLNTPTEHAPAAAAGVTGNTVCSEQKFCLQDLTDWSIHHKPIVDSLACEPTVK